MKTLQSTLWGTLSAVIFAASCGDATQQQSADQVTEKSLLQQGREIVAQRGCANCHQGDAKSGTLSGRLTSLPGSSVYAPNLTPDKETGVGEWTDAQLIAAIRTGVDDEGENLCAQMPRFSDLSDHDVKAVVAYLRSLPAITQEIPESECDRGPASTDPGKKVIDANGCTGCHGPTLGGSDQPLPNTMIYPPNLTPDPDTGLGEWSDDQIATAIRTGIDDEGATLCAVMPRFSKLSDDEVKAVVKYLKGLTPLRHEVSESECAEHMPPPDAGAEDTDAGMSSDAGTSTSTDAGAESTDAGEVVDAGTTTHDAGLPSDAGSAHDAGTSTDAGPSTDAGTQNDGGIIVVPLPDAGTKGTWVVVTHGVPLPPVWEADVRELSTDSPSVDAMAHLWARVEVKARMTGSDNPCPLPYDTIFYSACDGFTATATNGAAVVDTYVYLGASPTCVNSLPPATLMRARGVFDTHFDSASQVTSYVIAATTCADLELGAEPVEGSHMPLPSTDIARVLTPFPRAGKVVAVRGVVTATHVSNSLYSFVIQDPAGGPHSGALVVKRKQLFTSLGFPPAVGDYVLVTGTATQNANGRNEIDL